MNGSIYKITNDVNDKMYVGKTLLNIQKRFSQHKAESLRNKNEKGETVKIFSGRKEAVEWLIKNEYAQTKDFHNISIAIGRVLNGKRKRAYDFYWEDI